MWYESHVTPDDTQTARQQTGNLGKLQGTAAAAAAAAVTLTKPTGMGGDEEVG